MPDVIEHNADTIGELPDAEPLPVRYWWLRRLLIGGGCLLLVLVAIRLWWGWEAHRRFQAEIDKCLAAGEPILPADFNPKQPIPDDRNAAKSLLDAEAALMLALTPDQQRLVTRISDGDADVREHVEELEEIATAITPVLAMVADADSKPEADWGVRFTSPAVSAMMLNLAGQRNLVKALNVAALHQHASGADAAAIETLRLAWAQTEIVDAYPTLLSHLNAIASRAAALRSLESLSPSLSISAMPDSGSETATNVPREKVIDLIAAILDEARCEAALRRAFQIERAVQFDVVQLMQDGQLSLQGLMSWGTVAPSEGERIAIAVCLPVIKLDGIAMIRETTRVIDAVDAGQWSAVDSILSEAQDRVENGRFVVRPLAAVLGHPFFSSAIGFHFRQLAESRMTAIALAIRLYEVDHGQRPTALAQLVPDYLEAIPADPFAADGRPIVYAPDAAPPVLYSVGGDGVDDGGAFRVRGRGWVYHKVLDIPFFLNGDRPGRTP